MQTAPVPVELVDQARKVAVPRGRLLQRTTPYVRYLAINTQKVPDVRVRRAIGLALDRDAWAAAAGGAAAGTVAASLLSPTLPGYQRRGGTHGPEQWRRPRGRPRAAPWADRADAELLLQQHAGRAAHRRGRQGEPAAGRLRGGPPADRPGRVLPRGRPAEHHLPPHGRELERRLSGRGQRARAALRRAAGSGTAAITTWPTSANPPSPHGSRRSRRCRTGPAPRPGTPSSTGSWSRERAVAVPLLSDRYHGLVGSRIGGASISRLRGQPSFAEIYVRR